MVIQVTTSYFVFVDAHYAEFWSHESEMVDGIPARSSRSTGTKSDFGSMVSHAIIEERVRGTFKIDGFMRVLRWWLKCRTVPSEGDVVVVQKDATTDNNKIQCQLLGTVPNGETSL